MAEHQEDDAGRRPAPYYRSLGQVPGLRPGGRPVDPAAARWRAGLGAVLVVPVAVELTRWLGALADGEVVPELVVPLLLEVLGLLVGFVVTLRVVAGATLPARGLLGAAVAMLVTSLVWWGVVQVHVLGAMSLDDAVLLRLGRSAAVPGYQDWGALAWNVGVLMWAWAVASLPRRRTTPWPSGGDG